MPSMAAPFSVETALQQMQEENIEDDIDLLMKEQRDIEYFRDKSIMSNDTTLKKGHGIYISREALFNYDSSKY
jgi:hypothetical protein